jgi:hypothetical protein
MAARDTPKELPQHPLVDRMKPDPGQVATKLVTLVGLPGKSDRASYQRLYLTAKLDYYAEFQISAMMHTETVPADQSPIAGQEATSVSLARDAAIQYIWATSVQPIDEFDLDVRLGARGAVPAVSAISGPTCPHNNTCDVCTNTCADSCFSCDTCATQCQGHTCRTCNATCSPTCPGTCQTCNQQTCQMTCNQQTCQMTCDQQTCQVTACDDDTCHRTCTCHGTCQTCDSPSGCRC